MFVQFGKYTVGTPSNGQLKKCIKTNSKMNESERNKECEQCDFKEKCNKLKEIKQV